MLAMNIEKLPLGTLRLVAALGRHGSLSAAARQVGLSQPAASHALARLRRALGDPLFVRTSHGMHPTPYGERLGRAIEQALVALRSGVEPHALFDPMTSRRVFSLYLSDVGQMVFLPRLLEYLKREAPGIALRVRPVPVQAPHALLESGEVDIAVGYFTTFAAGFFQRRLFRERYVCVARADHPAFARGMSLDAFSSVPHAWADASGMAHELLEQLFRRQKVRREVKLVVPQFMVLPLVIAATDLLVVMPGRLAEQFARLVPLKVMEPPVRVPSYDIRMYWHERFHRDAANRWLRQTFAALFGTDARPERG
jgi:DNA-binding transcriptional LysR family regulator